jgi:hypothetical protein
LELAELVQLLVAAQDPDQLRAMIAMWTELGEIDSVTSIFWFVSRVVVEGSVGFLMIISSVLLVLRRNRAGLSLAVLALMFTLTAANLIAFYVDQFSTIAMALVQFVLLVAALVLQNRFEELAADVEEEAA